LVLFLANVVMHGWRPGAAAFLGAVHLGPFAVLARDDVKVPDLFRHATDAWAVGALIVLPLATAPAFLWWRTRLGIALSIVGVFLWFFAGFALFLVGRSV
jgi:hypothetical protein